jgi:uncharacterized protein (DUF4415 family)
MKESYDFTDARQGRVCAPRPETAGKVKITIRIDQDIVDYFMEKADKSGGASGYQTLINEALRRSIEAPSLEELVRQTIREELRTQRDAA